MNNNIYLFLQSLEWFMQWRSVFVRLRATTYWFADLIFFHADSRTILCEDGGGSKYSDIWMSQTWFWSINWKQIFQIVNTKCYIRLSYTLFMIYQGTLY